MPDNPPCPTCGTMLTYFCPKAHAKPPVAQQFTGGTLIERRTLVDSRLQYPKTIERIILHQVSATGWYLQYTSDDGGATWTVVQSRQLPPAAPIYDHRTGDEYHFGGNPNE